MLKRFAPVLIVLAAVALLAAQVTYQIPVWTGRSYTFPRLGPTLTIANGQLDVVQTSAKVRRYGVVLAYNTATISWTVPATAANIVVYCNGLRYTVAIDYTVTATGIKATGENMLPEYLVTADYDE